MLLERILLPFLLSQLLAQLIQQVENHPHRDEIIKLAQERITQLRKLIDKLKGAAP